MQALYFNKNNAFFIFRQRYKNVLVFPERGMGIRWFEKGEKKRPKLESRDVFENIVIKLFIHRFFDNSFKRIRMVYSQIG